MLAGAIVNEVSFDCAIVVDCSLLGKKTTARRPKGGVLVRGQHPMCDNDSTVTLATGPRLLYLASNISSSHSSSNA
jgi:hypothetical protein